VNQEKTMTHYQSSSPRKAFAIGAVALTAITIGLAVVLPAKMQSGDRDPRALATSKAIAPVEAVTERLRIEVVGVREPELISARVPSAPVKCPQNT
jgi:hypothetical protein